MARRGVVATSQPLAVQAGISMLQQGGNAVDAALATAIALTVVEPTSNGIGADAFALVWAGQKLHGLNGSGRAPLALNSGMLKGQGHTSMPTRGWVPVTVPGAPATWRDLHARFGKLPFDTLFQPAIYYAEQGYPLSPILAYYWGRAAAFGLWSRAGLALGAFSFMLYFFFLGVALLPLSRRVLGAYLLLSLLDHNNHLLCCMICSEQDACRLYLQLTMQKATQQGGFLHNL
jgi:hypothetical protein